MIIELPVGWKNTITNWSGVSKQTADGRLIYWRDYDTTLSIHFGDPDTVEVNDGDTVIIDAIKARIEAVARPPKMKPVYDWLCAEYDNYVGRSVTQLKTLVDAIDDPAVKAIIIIILVLLVALLHDRKAFNRDMELLPLSDWLIRIPKNDTQNLYSRQK